MNNMRLLVVFISLQPKAFSRRKLSKRRDQYKVALRQLNQVLPPEGWEVVVCENTRSAEVLKGWVNDTLRILGSEIVEVSVNSGSKNKGIGELDMMASALRGRDLRRFQSISYLTGRHVVCNPYVFLRTEQMKSDALLSNPDFLYLSGRFHSVEKHGMYNDMFFSMTPAAMRGYIDFFEANRDVMVKQGVGSEQLLFRYISGNGIPSEKLTHLGFLRRDIQRVWFRDRDRWHSC